MKSICVAISALFFVACQAAGAPEGPQRAGGEDGIRATQVTVDVPWGSGDIRLRARSAELGQRRDILRLGGDVRFDWAGRVTGEASRAVIDIRKKSASLEDDVRASFTLDDAALFERKRPR